MGIWHDPLILDESIKTLKMTLYHILELWCMLKKYRPTCKGYILLYTSSKNTAAIFYMVGWEESLLLDQQFCNFPTVHKWLKNVRFFTKSQKCELPEKMMANVAKKAVFRSWTTYTKCKPPLFCAALSPPWFLLVFARPWKWKLRFWHYSTRQQKKSTQKRPWNLSKMNLLFSHMKSRQPEEKLIEFDVVVKFGLEFSKPKNHPTKYKFH